MRKSIFMGFIVLASAFFLFPQEAALANKFKSGRVAGGFGFQKVPFLLSGHKIFVKVRINESRMLDFVLDTGAITSINRKIAGELGLEEGAVLPSITKSGRACLSRRPITLRLGDIKVEEFIPVIADLPALGEGEPDLDGFVGADLMSFFCVDLDYDAGEIVLSAALPELKAPFFRVPMRKHIPLGFPLVEGRLNGEKTISLMIDTGSPFVIVSPLALIENDKVFAKSSVDESRGIMMAWPGAASNKNYRTRAELFEIGDIKFLGTILYFAELPGPFSFSLLGYGFLKRFHTILDFPRGESIWIPKPGGFHESDESSGMAARKKEGHLIVRGLWPRSPADRAGIQVGDEIARIDGREARTLSSREIDVFLSEKMSNDIELELVCRGGVKKVILRKDR
jgi:predicted aspartyl protease